MAPLLEAVEAPSGAAEPDDSHRRIAGIGVGRAVAELAGLVVAPAHERAVCVERAVVAAAGGELCDRAVEQRGRDRLDFVFADPLARTVAERAEQVAAPALDIACLLYTSPSPRDS